MRNKLTQKELGEKVGLTGNMIGEVEAGRVQPSVKSISKLADVLGVSVDYLLGRTDK
jgi:transcriptional regulator with XRE-family HTH domain